MIQMSPGVERAVASARVWAERLGSESIRLAHFVLALLDEEEGRPAVLLQRIGVEPAAIRPALEALTDSPLAPADAALFSAARNWSLAYRHDPEFLTDAFLIAVLSADPTFTQQAAGLGLDIARLEGVLTGHDGLAVQPELRHSEAVFAITGSAGDMDSARILDANLNRAREAARVVEDYCRFALDDRFLTEQLKDLRHELGAISARFPPHLLLAARETLRDVGTSVSASGEYERTTPAHVVAVNLKRIQESLRTLEEYGKLFGSDIGRELESLRYRTYTLERAIVTGSTAREKLAGAKLYVLVTGRECGGALDWTIERAAAGGAQIIQLREKALEGRELLGRARNVRRWTRKAGVLFVVNDRPDIARLAEADGVHLGQEDLSVKDARRVMGPEAIIGVSTHTIAQVRQAILDGADYIGIGPVFPSMTKAFEEFPGLEFVRAASRETTIPAFALGGISTANLGAVVAAGARRVAVSSAVARAEDPEQAARELRAGLE